MKTAGGNADRTNGAGYCASLASEQIGPSSGAQTLQKILAITNSWQTHAGGRLDGSARWLSLAAIWAASTPAQCGSFSIESVGSLVQFQITSVRRASAVYRSFFGLMEQRPHSRRYCRQTSWAWSARQAAR